MEGKKEIAIVAIIAALFRLPLLSQVKMVMWDGAVYLMNARWFAGQKIFWEPLRAPLFPFMLSFFFRIGIYSELFFRIVSISFSIASIVITYFVAKKFFGEKTAILSAAILLVIPLHVLWSPMIYTEIPSSVLLLASIYLVWKGMKNEKLMYLAFFMSGLTFLTKYPLGILFPSILLFLFMQKKLNMKKLVIYSTIFILTISPWLAYNYTYFGDPMYSFKEGIKWQGPVAQPVYFYISQMFHYASFVSLIFIFGGIYSIKFFKKPEIQLLLIFLILFIGFITVSAHKEERYILPAIPILAIFSSYFIEKVNIKKMAPVLAVLILLTAHASMKLEHNSCEGIIEASQNLSGTVASTYWPLTAYYGSVNATSMPADYNKFHTFLENKSVSYVVASSNGGWPPYAQNFSFFDSQKYLTPIKEVSDKCQTYKVYEVKL